MIKILAKGEDFEHARSINNSFGFHKIEAVLYIAPVNISIPQRLQNIKPKYGMSLGYAKDHTFTCVKSGLIVDEGEKSITD